MLNWFKKLLGIAPVETKPLVLETPVATKPKKTTTAKPKKAATKKAAPKKKAIDLSAMKKDELLNYAKKVGAKANASMKKNDIIAAINVV